MTPWDQPDGSCGKETAGPSGTGGRSHAQDAQAGSAPGAQGNNAGPAVHLAARRHALHYFPAGLVGLLVETVSVVTPTRREENPGDICRVRIARGREGCTCLLPTCRRLAALLKLRDRGEI